MQIDNDPSTSSGDFLTKNSGKHETLPKNDITLKNLNNICRFLMTLTKISDDFFLSQINENREICT